MINKRLFKTIVTPILVFFILNVLTLLISFYDPKQLLSILAAWINMLLPFIFAMYAGFIALKKLKISIKEAGLAGLFTTTIGSVLSIILFFFINLFTIIPDITNVLFVVMGVISSLIIGFLFGALGGFIGKRIK